MSSHSHVYVGASQGQFESRTWFVMILTLCSMIIEVTCGIAFGSLALVADGIHMGTHCIAFFLTALAYSYSRVHKDDPFYVFGTGKVAELASYTSACILIVVALIIIYESIVRFIRPEPIIFYEALPVAFVGLSVNIASGFILMCRCEKEKIDEETGEVIQVDMAHGHGHGHEEHYEYDDVEGGLKGHTGHDETFNITTPQGTLTLSIFEEGVPPEFRVAYSNWQGPVPSLSSLAVATVRSGGVKQVFKFKPQNPKASPTDVKALLHSTVDIPEPHEFHVEVSYQDGKGATQMFPLEFTELADHHGHGGGGHAAHDETFPVSTSQGILTLSIFEDGVPPEFRVSYSNWTGAVPDISSISVTTTRVGDVTQTFDFAPLNLGAKMDVNTVLHSTVDIPEPHEFKAEVSFVDAMGHTQKFPLEFVEHAGHHGGGYAMMESLQTAPKAKFNRDNNYRAAICHVVADAFVSVLVIVALVIIGLSGRAEFLDPLVALVGAAVIFSWSFTLIRDTTLNLLDTMPDKDMVVALRAKLEADGSQVHDLHVWRLGPGHLGAVISLTEGKEGSTKDYYMKRIKGFKALSHVTVEIHAE